MEVKVERKKKVTFSKETPEKKVFRFKGSKGA